MAEIKKIQSLTEIPSEDRYVLVMSGISTHDTIHSRGATFAVNDGFLNRNRVSDLANAMSNANRFADEKRLPRIYLLEID